MNIPIETLIHTVRGQKVLLDAGLAGLYGGPTKTLNQADKKNADRFPPDSWLQLVGEESGAILASRSQNVTLCTQPLVTLETGALRSRFVTPKCEGWRTRRFRSASFPAGTARTQPCDCSEPTEGNEGHEGTQNEKRAPGEQEPVTGRWSGNAPDKDPQVAGLSSFPSFPSVKD
ncbi:MAG: ORF6N domain-containing protein [Verrucomicrobiales bacterium]|nr:ORF6N domain-containing protein [Verrucomicrobiales bacterium]